MSGAGVGLHFTEVSGALEEDLGGRSVETEPILGTPKDMLLSLLLSGCPGEGPARGPASTWAGRWLPGGPGPPCRSCTLSPQLPAEDTAHSPEICSSSRLDLDIPG